MDPTRDGRSARDARTSTVFGNFVRSLMLVLLTTSHSAWLPVALAQPVPRGPEYTTNNQLLPPVAIDSTGNSVIVWESFGSARTDTGRDPNNQAEPAVAVDSVGNLVVVWLIDGDPRVGHRSVALLSNSGDTSPGRERRRGREIQETSAQSPHGEEFTKGYVPPVLIDPSPSSSWNGGLRLLW